MCALQIQYLIQLVRLSSWGAIMDDADTGLVKAAYSIGDSLDRLSIAELQALLVDLDAEKARIDAEIIKKDTSRIAADSVFKL